MTREWMRARKRDYYYRLAKVDGYRSRAAYKLQQSSAKYRFIQKGDVIVDFGAAPGGWMQIARELVGTEGYVLVVDVEAIEGFKWENVTSVMRDIHTVDALTLRKALPRKVDVVLSDASPNISGVWEVDHARQIGLAETALKLAIELLRLKGTFFVKVFQGDLLREFINQVKRYFQVIRIVKPSASRKKSSERYLLALGFKGDGASGR